MINTTAITDLYAALTGAISARLDALYDADKIDAETYAKILAQSFDDALKLAVSATQQQEQIEKEVALKTAQTAQITQQTANLVIEGTNLTKQGALVDAQKEVQIQQKINLVAEASRIEAQTDLLINQAANAVKEGTVLVAQECKLRAEFDLLQVNKLKTQEETALLQWKTTTEKAQTLAMGVDADSVVGKQKALYSAQTAGYQRDAEQKTTKILVDSWVTRRTTDEATVADGVNMLHDAAIGRAVNKLLSGVNA